MTSCATWRAFTRSLIHGLVASSLRGIVYTGRFGGGSELLQGGDENNVWKILDEGMVYVPSLTRSRFSSDIYMTCPGTL